jgi:PAS domain S-box-containing protein
MSITPSTFAPWPRRARWALGLALAGLVLGVMAWSGRWAEQHETEARHTALQATVASHALGLRGAVGQYAWLPAVVAQHPEVQALLANPSDARAVAHLNAALEGINQRAGSAVVYLMDANGLTLASSNWQGPGSFVGQSYAQRPYVVQARAGQSSHFYGVGVTTGVPGLFIAEPVRQGGQVVGVVTVKVQLEALERAWAQSPDPVMLRDANGVVFLGTNPGWRYHRSRDLTPQEQAVLAANELYGRQATLPPIPWQVERQPGQAIYTVHSTGPGPAQHHLALDQPLPDYGWTLTVLTDNADIAQARDKAWLIAALGCAVLLLGTWVWRLRERRYAEQRQARQALEQRVQDRTRELQQAHTFRKAMEDSLPVGMRARDLSGRIIYVNRAMHEMVGYEADELLGCSPPYPYWHPDELDKHWRDSEAALQGQAQQPCFESRLRHKLGHDVHTLVYTAPLIDAQGVHQGWMSSVVDITRQKQAEAQQRAQEAQLQRAARLASLGEMASTLAHELNQPLMALCNFAAAAQALAQHGPPELLTTSLGDIQTQAQRAADIVQRIRGFVRPAGPSHQQLNIADAVANVLAWLQPEIRQRHTRIHTDVPADLPPIMGDRVLLEQLLLNLLLNALQALQGQAPETREITLTARVQAGQLVVTVADTGPGIADEVAGRLFEPFFTTKAEGLGLGLKICRSIAERHGGQLCHHPRAGGGSVFEVALPLA